MLVELVGVLLRVVSSGAIGASLLVSSRLRLNEAGTRFQRFRRTTLPFSVLIIKKFGLLSKLTTSPYVRISIIQTLSFTFSSDNFFVRWRLLYMSS